MEHPELRLAQHLLRMGILKHDGDYFVLPSQKEIAVVKSYMTPEDAREYRERLSFGA